MLETSVPAAILLLEILVLFDSYKVGANVPDPFLQQKLGVPSPSPACTGKRGSLKHENAFWGPKPASVCLQNVGVSPLYGE